MSAFFNNIPFFGTALFGIIAMITVGSSWCLIGLVMGVAPKRGIDASLIQLFGYAFSVAVGSVLMIATDSVPQGAANVIWTTCLVYAVCGVMIFCHLQIMSYAMQKGPNGIIWAIIQSALIFPFIGGIIFFGVQLTAARFTGIILLLAALVFFGIGKDNSNSRGNWKLPAFICLAICAVQQNLQTAPSYFEEARIVNSIVRTLSVASGGLAAAVIYNLVKLTSERKQLIRRNIGNALLWKFVAVLQIFSLIFSYTLMYPGMNAMADHGLGGMCYPMMVGSCIIAFTLSSVFLLKEKLQKLHIAALLLCFSGLVLICLPV